MVQNFLSGNVQYRLNILYLHNDRYTFNKTVSRKRAFVKKKCTRFPQCHKSYFVLDIVFYDLKNILLHYFHFA